METVDVIVVGGGPAGLSGALLLARCRRRVLVFDEGRPRNEKSRAVHAYLGMEGIPPLELLAKGRKELSCYPNAEFHAERVTRVIHSDPLFQVTVGSGGKFRSRALLVATGVIDKLPRIKDIERFYGTSIHQCPYCDGWESSGQKLGVFGRGIEAAELALELLLWSRQVRLFADGPLPPDQLVKKLERKGVTVESEPVVAIEGRGGMMETIRLKDGRNVPCERLFFVSSQIQQDRFLEDLGCGFDSEGKVECSPDGSTQTPGLYVAGNASPGLQLAMVAAAEGLRAAHQINSWLLEE